MTGFTPEEIEKQQYKDAVDYLIKTGREYHPPASPEEKEIKRKRQKRRWDDEKAYTFSVRLNREKDGALIDWLNHRCRDWSRNQYLKSLMRYDMYMRDGHAEDLANAADEYAARQAEKKNRMQPAQEREHSQIGFRIDDDPAPVQLPDEDLDRTPDDYFTMCKYQGLR